MMRAMPRLVTRITGRLKRRGGKRRDQRPASAVPTPCAMTLQQESRDREHAERQDDQDQQRQPSRIDPEEQAADGAMAVAVGRDVLADEFG